ncbi:MAG TPA: UDP-N-acetylmuramoyl-L-alanine--D-glutamate ligase [Candidatus Binataceae bacterium]|nr:UDP-N-acetylmuramoyl-L-alanine--D-glutamate ligase [Candidatus Binataceae bacterium]
MELNGKRVMVIGLGASGLAAARFLASRGAELVMTDRRRDLDRSILPGGELHLGEDDPAWLAGVGLLVTSPGVPPGAILLREAAVRGIPVIGEIELAARFIDAPIAAITGTNGKSTVTVLLGDMLKAAGRRTFVGGNLGTPLIEAVGPYEAVVAEVSSFQLESIDRFRPRVAIHLNLSDDHFDRYRGLDDYGAAKARIFENQRADDFAILNRDDPLVWKLARTVKSQVIAFSLERPGDGGSAIWLSGDRLEFHIGEKRGTLSIDQYRLAGRHNLQNAMAAAAAALVLDAGASVIERALREFRGLPHRIALVREKDGVRYVDDSKATNVGAVLEALEAMRGPVILIAGGVDKGGDYAPLREVVQRKVKCAMLNGAAREKIAHALAGAAEIEVVTTFREAVEGAARRARAGDTVLLSPACSSFDQFKDYAERGRAFEELVRAL